MSMSGNYAYKCGLTVDKGEDGRFEVEYADRSRSWTSGVARSVRWTVGTTAILCDFYVLDDLFVDVVLSNNYLFDMNIFSAHEEHFFDIDSEGDILRFCGIRLINQDKDEPESSRLVDSKYITHQERQNTADTKVCSDFTRCLRPRHETEGMGNKRSDPR